MCIIQHKLSWRLSPIQHNEVNHLRLTGAYLEWHKSLSGISKLRCCPWPERRCQLLAVDDFPVPTAFTPPASQTQLSAQVQPQVCGSGGGGGGSGGPVRSPCVPQAEPTHTHRLTQTHTDSSKPGEIGQSCPRAVRRLTELQQASLRLSLGGDKAA